MTGDYRIVPIGGGTATRLNDTLFPGGYLYDSYSISPDSRRVVYIAQQDTISADLYSSGLDSDNDFDGLFDYDEINFYSTDSNDADSDDDGLVDGDEVYIYGTDPDNADSDNDGIQDGTELGKITGHTTDTGAQFIPDADPSTKTNPLNPDSDYDGLKDGEEDSNYNGRLDEGESDPKDDGFPWELFYPIFIKQK